MKNQQGFSLIELAIVLVIVTLLIGGLAMPLSAQIQARRIAETKKIMEEARESIIGFAMINTCSCAYTDISPSGTLLPAPQTTCTTSCPTMNPSTSSTTLKHPYLPCPDTDAIADGRGNLTGTACTSDSGFFPWADLGTAAEDAWGNRLHYAIKLDYGNRGSGFNNSSTGNKHICDTSVGSCNVGNVAAAVPVVLVSYGPNGWGARNVNGSTLQAPTSTDELENFSTSPGLDPLSYISHPPSTADSAAGEFDDLVVWISNPLLISRVCPAPGGCP